MTNSFSEIKNCIDEKGGLIADHNDIQSSFRAAEVLCESLLGATLNIRGRKFIIRMLEIYYGSVADNAHDWYRNRFVYKTSKYKKQTEVQAQKGFKIYISSPNVEDSYTRLDIVVGNENTAISFLIRSVWDENFKLIGSKNGSPNIVLKAMGIKTEDHGKDITTDSYSDGEITIENTHDKIYADKGFKTIRQNRINLKSSDFEKSNNLMWNFYAE